MPERSPLCCCEVDGLEGGGNWRKNSQEAVVMSSGQKGFQAVAVELEKEGTGEREGPSSSAASAGRQLLQGMSCQPASPPAGPHLSAFEEAPPSWDFCLPCGPAFRSDHLPIFTSSSCRKASVEVDRSSLSCCLSKRSPCPALWRHLSSLSIWAEASEPLETSLRA